ncbi:SDH family Clp fold serine proteinase [Cryptosporangium minutisporangium]|uniref:Serine dehydrogenase proteinase n=1 Tax=Cryptosporangium minutisporangium TaxID=113569 RepID=A0ABP6T1J6_9ACTN
MDALTALASVRGRPVLCCHGRIDEDLADRLDPLVRDLPCGAGLDVVLSTRGGSPTGARRAVAVLADRTPHLAVLVGVRARSAGTLFCLGADEIVLTAGAELGPIDPVIEQASGDPAVGALSAADLRAFRSLAADWFDVSARENGVDLLALLSQRIAPTALARLYRADALARSLATALLRRSEADPAAIDAIVERLVAGYPSHDYPILRDEAREAGLPVVDATDAETRALRAVDDAGRAQFAAAAADGLELPTIVLSAQPEAAPSPPSLLRR